MKTEHTPEPWESVDSRVYFPNLAGGFSLHNCPDAEANARRIVACVNACAGIGTEYLEHFGGTTFNDFKRVKEQRDELLSEIEKMLTYCVIKTHPDFMHQDKDWEAHMYEAIASVKEK